MSTTETPKDPAGKPLCAWCGGSVPPSLGTKPRAYCKDGCKQRAYEARKLERQLQDVHDQEVAARSDRLFNAYLKGRADEAELRDGKSRDVGLADGKSRDFARSDGGKSRDVARKAQVKPPVPEQSVPPVPPPLSPLPPRSRRRSGMTASAMPIPGLEDADDE